MVKQYPKEVREHAITLRKQGLQYKEIRQTLKQEFGVDIHKATLERWLYKERLVKYYRPLEVRIEMARIIKKLYYEEKIGHGRIQKRLMELGYGKIPLSWINTVLRGISPDGKIKRIRMHSYEFGYVIGALIADGSVYQQSTHQICRLYTKDEEFRDKFRICAEKIGLHVYYYFDKTRKLWVIVIHSKILHDLLKTGRWSSLLIDPEEVQGFLEGFYDGDGVSLIPAFVNKNVRILEYIRELLRKQGIKASPPILNNGTKAKCNIYVIYIHPLDYDKLSAIIRPCIERKKYLMELSKKIITRYTDEIKNKESWWEVCRMLQRAVGKCMRKSRRKG